MSTLEKASCVSIRGQIFVMTELTFYDFEEVRNGLY